jgi:hypothetical protein
MTASIIRVDGAEAYDLLFTEHLSMLSTTEQDTMQRSLRNSAQVWIGRNDEDILVVWGLIAPTLMSDTAYLWMFHTVHLRKHTFMLVRHSQHIMQEMLKDFPTIVGHVRVEAKQSRQWLRWLGAEFGEPINNYVVPFTIKAKSQWQQDLVQSA